MGVAQHAEVNVSSVRRDDDDDLLENLKERARCPRNVY
jgi:hypothetical protein